MPKANIVAHHHILFSTVKDDYMRNSERIGWEDETSNLSNEILFHIQKVYFFNVIKVPLEKYEYRTSAIQT